MRRDLRARGLKPGRCTIADGHLGIWAALAEQPPTAAEPRGWNHRSVNVLDAIPKTQPAQARTLLCAMPEAENQTVCEVLWGQFAKRYSQLVSKAVARLITFDQFPRAHRRHRRTTRVLESPVAAVRQRATAATRLKQVDSATAMIWKLLQVAVKTYRQTDPPELLPVVYGGAKYANGIKQSPVNHQEVAA